MHLLFRELQAIVKLIIIIFSSVSSFNVLKVFFFLKIFDYDLNINI